jgi:hypothetical protein|uniref:Uncharacterized protein n=1 Tax=viral metagenome TaxID=1070528 RepID=A0A6C0BXU6_9ZZZZ
MKKSLEEQIRDQVKYPTTYTKYAPNKEYIKNLESKKLMLQEKKKQINEVKTKINDIKNKRQGLDNLIISKLAFSSNKQLITKYKNKKTEQINSLKNIIKQQKDMIDYYKKRSTKN